MSIAYVVFRNGLDGSNAMTHWHGQSLLDNVLTVTATALDAGMGGLGPAVGVGELDDEDGGLKIDAQKRAALMSRLASSAGITQPAAAAVPGAAPFTIPALASHPGAAAAGLGIMPGGLLASGAGLPGVMGAAAVAAGVPGVMGAAAAVPGMLNPGGDLSLQQGLLGPASPIPTQCLLLKNMFDASQQTEPNWVVEVAEDVRDECSKFGALVHVHVDKASQVCCVLWCVGVPGGRDKRTDQGIVWVGLGGFCAGGVQQVLSGAACTWTRPARSVCMVVLCVCEILWAGAGVRGCVGAWGRGQKHRSVGRQSRVSLWRILCRPECSRFDALLL
jgi:hypothetical protein